MCVCVCMVIYIAGSVVLIICQVIQLGEKNFTMTLMVHMIASYLASTCHWIIIMIT